MRARIGWGLWNLVKDKPELKNALSYIVDHDGTDILNIKRDRAVVMGIVAIILIVILPALYIIWMILFACCHVEKEVEVSEREWARLVR